MSLSRISDRLLTVQCLALSCKVSIIHTVTHSQGSAAIVTAVDMYTSVDEQSKECDV